MTMHKLYLRAPQQLTHTTTITAVEQGDKPYVRLAETIFHPQGGGQKADRGTIGTMQVSHVALDTGEVNHYVDHLGDYQVGDTVEITVDAAFRIEQARYHSAGHLIAHIAENCFPGIRAVAGHQWPGEARVDFTGTMEIASHSTGILEQAVNDAIAAGMPSQMVGDPFASRALQIGDYSPVPCGGTHVTNCREIGRVKIEKIK